MTREGTMVQRVRRFLKTPAKIGLHLLGQESPTGTNLAGTHSSIPGVAALLRSFSTAWLVLMTTKN